MLNTDPIEGIIPLRNRKWRGIEDLDEEGGKLRSRFRESELKNRIEELVVDVSEQDKAPCIDSWP